MLKASVVVDGAGVLPRRIVPRWRARAGRRALAPTGVRRARAPARRASTRRRANMSSMAAPYSRRNASGDRRSSQRYIRMSRLAADTACAAVPLARAPPGARLPAPRLVVPLVSTRSTCAADPRRRVRQPGQLVLRPSDGAVPGTGHRSWDRGVRPIAPRRPVRSRIRATARGRARGGRETRGRAVPESGRFPSRVDWTAFPVGRLADGKL